MNVHCRFFLVVPGLMAEVTPASADCQRCQCPRDEASVCPGRVLCSVPCSADRDHRCSAGCARRCTHACAGEGIGLVLYSPVLWRARLCHAAHDAALPWHGAAPALVRCHPRLRPPARSWGGPRACRKKNQISFQALALPRWKKKYVKTASEMKMHLYSPVSLSNRKYLLALRSLS